jgi:hypothetical protein
MGRDPRCKVFYGKYLPAFGDWVRIRIDGGMVSKVGQASSLSVSALVQA